MKTLVTIFLLPLGVKVMPVLLPFQRLLLSSIKWLWTFVDNHMMEEFFSLFNGISAWRTCAPDGSHTLPSGLRKHT